MLPDRPARVQLLSGYLHRLSTATTLTEQALRGEAVRYFPNTTINTELRTPRIAGASPTRPTTLFPHLRDRRKSIIPASSSPVENAISLPSLTLGCQPRGKCCAAANHDAHYRPAFRLHTLVL